METDKLRAYVLEILFFVSSFLFVFLLKNILNYIYFIFLLLFWFLVSFFLSKKKNNSFYQDKVVILIVLLSVVYLLGLFGVGCYFGFTKTLVKVSFVKVILPGIVSFYFIERIRALCLEQPGKYHDIFSFLGSFLFYVLIFGTCQKISILSMIFPIIACCLLSHFLAKRFGYQAAIIYPISILFYYMIPLDFNTPFIIQNVISIFYPYFINFTIESTFSKDNGFSAYHNRKKNAYKTGFVVCISILLVCLVSCQFRYGLLVVGSESMSGAINKGDVVFFQKYQKQLLKKNDVIVFQEDDLLIIHRIINIQKVNGRLRYYTKGDANPYIDDFNVVDSHIKGVVLFKIPYIGNPTLWIKK